MNYESISDDALFGSGTDSWNVNTRSSPRLPEQIGEETDNIMTLRNHDDSKNGYDRQSNGRSQQDQVRSQHERSPQSSSNELHAVYDPSDLFTVRPDPTRLPGHSVTPSGSAIPADKGARAKVLKNKENKSKNNTKRTQIVKNSENRENRIGENRVVPRQFRAFNDSTEWQPVLQYKQYEDDNEETDLLKPVNNSKNSKKHKNKNAPKSAPLPSIPRLPSTGSISDNDMLSLQSIPMPAGLSPSSRPQDFVHHIYLKDNNQLQQNGLELANSATDIGQPLSSENQTDSLLSVSAGTSNPQNVTPIYNNLWEGRGKKQSNEDSMSSMINLNTNNEGIHLVNNDLEVDLAPHQQVSGSRLEHPIVVPYQTQNRHTLRMENIQCNGETSQSENVPSMNFNSSSNLTNSLPSSFLVDEYNDSVLFGDGYDKDFLLAQKLQRQYDQENEEFQHQRQFDLPSSVQRQFNPANEQPINSQRNDIHVTQPLSSENAEPSRNWPSIENSLNTLDYQTALLPSFEDSLTNEQDPVYVPEEIVSPVQPSEPIVIAIENESRGDNENRPQEETGRVHEPLVVTIPFDREQLQNDEHYPQTVSVRENIHIPYEESGAGGLVARSDSPPQLPDRYRNNDERYARLVQERQDEELARQLQEEDERRSNLVGRNNPRFYHQYRRPRNSEPLRQRFSDTWTRRPLIVSSGALNNNVADSQVRRPNTSSERPLVTGNGNEFSYLDNVHSIPIAGYDIPPGHDYYYRYENDPDLMLDEHGEDRLISINRDPQLLATLLMTRDPDMMIPNDVDLNDYEALWELAENLGEVRRVGMDQKDISLLPVHVHESTKKQNTDDNSFDCLVCLSEFKSGERLRTLPCCHVYHVDCIDEWLKRNAVCPVCRRSAKQDHSQQH